MIFASYCAEILVWQLKHFSWTEANVKSGSVKAQPKGLLGIVEHKQILQLSGERDESK